MIGRREFFSTAFAPFLRIADDARVWAVRCRCAVRPHWLQLKNLVASPTPVRMTRKDAQKILESYMPFGELVFLPDVSPLTRSKKTRQEKKR